MSVKRVIMQNLKKNIKHYYVYVFALVCSVVLYFSFVTLQADSEVALLKAGVKGSAASQAGSVVLVAIVAVFLFYANNLFIKRRGKEIGLFQLVGMTKGQVFKLLSLENAMLYGLAFIPGILIGVSISKLLAMIVLKLTEAEAVAHLTFSGQAFWQTVVVFGCIYGFIMVFNYIFIKRQTVLSLFHATQATEEGVRRVSLLETIIGILGVASILVGYYVSSKLLTGDISDLLFWEMLFVLASVIIGTYFFYKGSIAFFLNLIRKKKDGSLGVSDVLALAPVMFRMKSNALLLTIITTISALAIGLLSLSYISYYSIEPDAKSLVANDFAFTSIDDATHFESLLEENKIAYQIKQIDDIMQMEVDTSDISGWSEGVSSVISDRFVDGLDLSADEAAFTGYAHTAQRLQPLKESGTIKLIGQEGAVSLDYTGLFKEYGVIYSFFSMGNRSPVVIVDETTFQRLAGQLNEDLQSRPTVSIGIDIVDKRKLEKANTLYHRLSEDEDTIRSSLSDMVQAKKEDIGLKMFVVGFVGFAFLIASGCILYFKQMDESEAEKGSYTILRKIGFSESHLVKGICMKQLYSFGIPLIVGLVHSYFAVQAGWFLFGGQLWAPMLVVMILYAAFYSIFAVLSVLYYKKVIRGAL